MVEEVPLDEVPLEGAPLYDKDFVSEESSESMLMLDMRKSELEEYQE